MYLPSRILINEFKQNVKVLTNLVAQVNTFSTKPELKSSNVELPNVSQSNNDKKASTPVDYRFIYPEFLPDPKIEWRNAVREKLERKDMLSRRAHIDIPEFYVGTIMAVTTSDVHSEGKTSRFVGICIDRSGCGLRSKFILRNVVDHQGCEVLYEMYDPTIQKIEVLRLEKRLDSKLFYLRDALPEFSTFPLDMEAEILPEGAPVPVNEIKVKLKPRPWLERWERQDLKGIQPLELPEKFFIKAKERSTPWEKYDLMKQYRATIPEEEQNVIYAEVYSELHQLELMRRKQKRRRIFVKPVKAA
ncbi:39S ribosomal protein L19, mitochondrial-like [Ctenocephalides felis]|uniref:39S ribosomal protein L19, mitochondrial-like n=1 Tax=Ctenocephalides felis TaxID=7515 RepID=UPI000E6E42AE|nr:39S ribosomal protein L19, mitochondrial-like [Ctenocephalides felis]